MAEGKTTSMRIVTNCHTLMILVPPLEVGLQCVHGYHLQCGHSLETLQALPPLHPGKKSN